MYEMEKREVIKAGITMDRYGLIALSGGNVSVRMPNNDILVTPSGMIYEDMVEDDVLVVSLDGKVIEGTRKPSVDTKALLYIFNHRPEINAVVHTHQPYATAVGIAKFSIEKQFIGTSSRSGWGYPKSEKVKVNVKGFFDRIKEFVNDFF